MGDEGGTAVDEHACYLRWRYQRSRMLFLIRDPCTAYRSYRMFRPWYRMWPSHPIVTATDFGEFWRELADGFLREHREVGGMVVHYESLARDDGALTGRIAEFVGMPLRPSVLERKVIDRQWPLQPVPASVLAERRQAVEWIASQLGYAPAAGRSAPSSR